MMTTNRVKVIGTIATPVPGAAVLEIPETSSSVVANRTRPAAVFGQAHWAGVLPRSLCEAHARAGYIADNPLKRLQENLLDNKDYVKSYSSLWLLCTDVNPQPVCSRPSKTASHIQIVPMIKMP